MSIAKLVPRPWWLRLLTGFAREVVPEIWGAIVAGDDDKAARLAALAATRRADHLSAKKMLDELADQKPNR